MPSDAMQDIAYRYLQDTATVIFLVFNREGQVILANRHTEQLLGRGIVGRSFRQVFLDFIGSLRFNTSFIAA